MNRYIASVAIVTSLCLLTTGRESVAYQDMPQEDVQQDDFDWAADHFLVRVREGVEPILYPGGFYSFTQAAGQSAESMATEMPIAGILASCDATAVEPLIQFELSDVTLEKATELGILRQYVIHVSPDSHIFAHAGS